MTHRCVKLLISNSSIKSMYKQQFPRCHHIQDMLAATVVFPNNDGFPDPSGNPAYQSLPTPGLITHPCAALSKDLESQLSKSVSRDTAAGSALYHS